MSNLLGRSFCALALLSCAAFAAPNAKLTEAKKAFDDLELDQALKLLDQADKLRGNERETVLEIYTLQGVAWATLGKADKAREAFRALLVLDPDHKLPGTQPPRVRTPFYESKEWAAGKGTFKVEGDAKLTTRLDAVSVKVTGDVFKLARVAVFHVDLGGARPMAQTVALGKDGVASLEVGQPSAHWSAEVLGERDQVLAVLAPRDDPPVKVVATPDVPLANPLKPAAPPPSSVVAAGPEASGWMRPAGIGLLVAGAVAAGVGGYFGFLVVDAQGDLQKAKRDGNGVVTGLTQVEAARLDAQARDAAPIANGLFVTGAVLAGAGAVLVLLGAPTDGVAVAPAPGGLTVSGRF